MLLTQTNTPYPLSTYIHSVSLWFGLDVEEMIYEELKDSPSVEIPPLTHRQPE
jgi:hypothetical protein